MMTRVIDMDHIVYKPENCTVLTVLTLTFSSLGIALSALSLALLLLTAVLFAEWRQNYKNQLLIQFMIARFGYTLVRYFYDVMMSLDVYERPTTSVHFDIYLRFYTELALIAWMFVFTKQMYECLVKVFSVDNLKLWKVSLCSWLIPAVITTFIYFAFIVQTNKDLQIFLFYLIIIKWPVLVANAILLILITKSILSNNKSKTEKNIRIVIVMIVLLFSFCFQQVVIDVYKVICMWLFFNFNSMSDSLDIGLVLFNMLSLYYCAFSIMFWLFGNAQTRKLWRFQRSHLPTQNSFRPGMSSK